MCALPPPALVERTSLRPTAAALEVPKPRLVTVPLDSNVTVCSCAGNSSAVRVCSLSPPICSHSANSAWFSSTAIGILPLPQRSHIPPILLPGVSLTVVIFINPTGYTKFSTSVCVIPTPRYGKADHVDLPCRFSSCRYPVLRRVLRAAVSGLQGASLRRYHCVADAWYLV